MDPIGFLISIVRILPDYSLGGSINSTVFDWNAFLSSIFNIAPTELLISTASATFPVVLAVFALIVQRSIPFDES
ncbi:MAG: hypothetical protein QXR62_04425 [Candidatus Bathyarchaeia archaeon]